MPRGGAIRGDVGDGGYIGVAMFLASPKGGARGVANGRMGNGWNLLKTGLVFTVFTILFVFWRILLWVSVFNGFFMMEG